MPRLLTLLVPKSLTLSAEMILLTLRLRLLTLNAVFRYEKNVRSLPKNRNLQVHVLVGTQNGNSTGRESVRLQQLILSCYIPWKGKERHQFVLNTGRCGFRYLLCYNVFQPKPAGNSNDDFSKQDILIQ